MAAAVAEMSHPLKLPGVPTFADAETLKKAYDALGDVYSTLLTHSASLAIGHELKKYTQAFNLNRGYLTNMLESTHPIGYSSAKNALQTPAKSDEAFGSPHSIFWADVNNFVNFVKYFKEREDHYRSRLGESFSAVEASIQTCAVQFQIILNQTREKSEELEKRFYKHVDPFLPPEASPRRDAAGQSREHYDTLLEQIAATLNSLTTHTTTINPHLQNNARNPSTDVDNEYTRLLRKLREQKELVEKHLEFFQGPRSISSRDQSAAIAAAHTPEQNIKLLEKLCSIIKTAKDNSWHTMRTTDSKLMSPAERAEQRANLDRIFRPMIIELAKGCGMGEAAIDRLFPPEPKNIKNKLLLHIEVGFNHGRQTPELALVEIDTSSLSTEAFQADLTRQVLAGLVKQNRGITITERSSSDERFLKKCLTETISKITASSTLLFGSDFSSDPRHQIRTVEQLQAAHGRTIISFHIPEPTAAARAASPAKDAISSFFEQLLHENPKHNESIRLAYATYQDYLSRSSVDAYKKEKGREFQDLQDETMSPALKGQFNAILDTFPSGSLSREGSGGDSGGSSPRAPTGGRFGFGGGGGGSGGSSPRAATPFFSTAATSAPELSEAQRRQVKDAINYFIDNVLEDSSTGLDKKEALRTIWIKGASLGGQAFDKQVLAFVTKCREKMLGSGDDTKAMQALRGMGGEYEILTKTLNGTLLKDKPLPIIEAVSAMGR